MRREMPALPEAVPSVVQDLGVAPLPPGLTVTAHVPPALPTEGVIMSSAELELAPLPPQLPRLAGYPLAPTQAR
jgi:hypothetical protein